MTVEAAPQATYVEMAPPPDLAGELRCLWHSVIGGPTPILPDGCLDLIVAPDQIFVAGPDTRAWTSTIPAGAVLYGVRFQPGRAPRMLGVPAHEHCDRCVELSTLWGRGRADRQALDLAERVRDDPAAMLSLVTRRLAETRATADDEVDELVHRLARGGAADGRVGPLATRLGVGERQLRRRFTAAVGYGPATYLRIMRLQRARAIARERPDLPIADIAAASGYADQPHLSRDSRELAATTPRELLRLSTP